MQVKKIDNTQRATDSLMLRPSDFDTFIGQDPIKKMMKTAISSSQKRGEPLGHTLFSGPSGFGKTSLAHLISQELGKQIVVITGYALSKPAELISVLNTLQHGDILFIDEIHRLKPVLEEMLYIAMEDRALDMVLPEGGNVRVPLSPFTLIGATTKLEKLSDPLKNRFVYSFHFEEYTSEQKGQIILRYLNLYHVETSAHIIQHIAQRVQSVPREIHNFCIKIRDFLTAHPIKGNTHSDKLILSDAQRNLFQERINIDEDGLSPLHYQYLKILEECEGPVGLRTLALKLGIDEVSVEEDIERVLIKRGKIQKTTRGRILG